MRDDGLVLAASLGAELPDADLTRYVTSFWQQHLSGDDVATAFMPDPQVTSPGSRTLGWIDLHGASYQPILIGAHASGERVYVGVAVLIANAQPNADPRAAQITVSVGGYLLGSGDAIAVDA